MKSILSFLLTVQRIFGFAQTDEETIKNVVNTAYVQGIHNNGLIDDIRGGFHPSFSMLRLTDNEVAPLPIADWIDSIEKRRAANPTVGIEIVGKFINVDVTGNAATVRQNKQIPSFVRLENYGKPSLTRLVIFLI